MPQGRLSLGDGCFELIQSGDITSAWIEHKLEVMPPRQIHPKESLVALMNDLNPPIGRGVSSTFIFSGELKERSASSHQRLKTSLRRPEEIWLDWVIDNNIYAKRMSTITPSTTLWDSFSGEGEVIAEFMRYSLTIVL